MNVDLRSEAEVFVDKLKEIDIEVLLTFGNEESATFMFAKTASGNEFMISCYKAISYGYDCIKIDMENSDLIPLRVFNSIAKNECSKHIGTEFCFLSAKGISLDNGYTYVFKDPRDSIRLGKGEFFYTAFPLVQAHQLCSLNLSNDLYSYVFNSSMTTVMKKIFQKSGLSSIIKVYTINNEVSEIARNSYVTLFCPSDKAFEDVNVNMLSVEDCQKIVMSHTFKGLMSGYSGGKMSINSCLRTFKNGICDNIDVSVPAIRKINGDVTIVKSLLDWQNTTLDEDMIATYMSEKSRVSEIDIAIASLHIWICDAQFIDRNTEMLENYISVLVGFLDKMKTETSKVTKTRQNMVSLNSKIREEHHTSEIDVLSKKLMVSDERKRIDMLIRKFNSNTTKYNEYVELYSKLAAITEGTMESVKVARDV